MKTTIKSTLGLVWILPSLTFAYCRGGELRAEQRRASLESSSKVSKGTFTGAILLEDSGALMKLRR